MLKKTVTGFTIALFLFTCSISLFAQDPPKKKGKEKIMIFNGDNLKVQLYGFVKLDAVYNSTNVAAESSPLFVASQNYFVDPAFAGTISPGITTPYYLIPKYPAERDGSLVFDARTSRLGIKVFGPKAIGATTMALVEADFWGDHATSATAARQGQVRMRHAYGKLAWKFGDMAGLSLIVGQNWSIAMPIFALAKTANFLPWGFNGLIFMREPQVSVGVKIGPKIANLLIEGAIARVQAGNDTGAGLYPGVKGVQLDERGAGEASKIPGYRARMTLRINPIKMINIKAGITGHYQQERHPFAFSRLVSYGLITAPVFASKMTNNVDSFSVGAFTKASVSLVTVVGAWFSGWNMDTFLCGLGEGAVENLGGYRLLAVHSTGGYIQGQIDFRKVAPVPISLAAGWGGEWKDNTTTINPGKIIWNTTLQGSVWYYMNNYITFGFEVSQHETKYKRMIGVARDMKYQGTMIFKF